MTNVANIYEYNGRLIAYLSDDKKVVSYPRCIMENYLGRKLMSDEQVHHKDGNPLNNDINNLEVVTCKEHWKIHADNNRKYYDMIINCPECKNDFLWTAKQQLEFYRNIKRKNKSTASIQQPFCSKRCSGMYGKRIQMNKIH